MAPTRRGVLIGALAGGGLALGFVLRPRRFPLPLKAGPDQFAFDAWLKIDTQGVVTVAVPQVEMGQGITTVLPQIVAAELGADWRQIAVEPAPPSALYANTVLAAEWAPLWMPTGPRIADALAGDPVDLLTRRWAQDNRFDVTADGTALAAYEAPARAAGAIARSLLTQAAAARWGVTPEECAVAGGLVTYGDKALSFGLLAEAAAGLTPPSPPPLQSDPEAESPEEFPPGAPLRHPRLDLPAKVDGSWTFAGDIRLPDMLFAAIRHGPLGVAQIAGLDEQAGKGLKGFVRFVEGADWVAAVARDWWTAEQALQRAAPHFRVSHAADGDAIDLALDAAMTRGDPHRIHLQGDAEAVSGGLPVQLRYEVAPALHATIETASATARLDEDGRLELWIGTQAPEAARRAAAKAAGVGAGDVVLYPMPIGGSFDRRLEFAQGAEVATIAKAVGKPVQLTWSRRQEHVAGLPRTPAVAVMAARPDGDGQITAWRARIAVPATAREFGERLFGAQSPADAARAVQGVADPLALSGAVPGYDIANLAVDHVPAALDLPTGRMRGNAHGYTAFFNECFVDELAHRAGCEPLSYRMAMLGGDPRMAECLQRVSSLANWDGGSDNSGQGIACHRIGDARIGEGRIALVARVRRDEGGVRVDALSAVVDIGRIVNIDIARQQIEGGLIFGLGLALGSAGSWTQGWPDADRLSALAVPALKDCPQIDVGFVTSTQPPADPGELGVAVAAPAIANALFSATGLRLRRLPLFAEDA
ncbi:molybdopterin cofactor-binding domain-containing protein [Novosphingobium sp. 9]|uniref:molybdopterin cofactor-binding domain-containing protein n=1 Tax=Novosphingobium sp. 9 TaxID=2025349 RepID=UPI0021B6947A|nr:molybdopterin cofactor-binding domain-containing protein [Novosphingobium sp. 9]